MVVVTLLARDQDTLGPVYYIVVTQVEVSSVHWWCRVSTVDGVMLVTVVASHTFIACPALLPANIMYTGTSFNTCT